MASHSRSSKITLGDCIVTVKQISAKRYKRALSVDPNLCHCHWCEAVMITPPKAIYMNVVSCSDGASNRSTGAVLVCKACRKFKPVIVREYVSTGTFTIAPPRAKTGASNE